MNNDEGKLFIRGMLFGLACSCLIWSGLGLLVFMQ